MKLIFISGPSGSGKTTLSKQILGKIKNGIVLSTDNYYKIGLLSNLLSKFVSGYFDRSISFNYNLFKKDFKSIVQNRISIYERSYNFKKKTIKSFLKEKNNIEFLIVEGIFAKKFLKTLYNQKIFLIELKTKKSKCMERVLLRDLKERGKEKKQSKIDFLKSWDIYNNKSIKKSLKENTNKIIILKKTNIDFLLKKIFNYQS